MPFMNHKHPQLLQRGCESHELHTETVDHRRMTSCTKHARIATAFCAMRRWQTEDCAVAISCRRDRSAMSRDTGARKSKRKLPSLFEPLFWQQQAGQSNVRSCRGFQTVWASPRRLRVCYHSQTKCHRAPRAGCDPCALQDPALWKQWRVASGRGARLGI